MDSQPIHVWPQSPTNEGERILCRAVIERPGADRFNLDYRFPVEYASAISSQADAYVSATVFLAMRENRPLHVHGTVSPVLLRNLQELQSVWNNLRPDEYHQVPIHVDHEAESPAQKPSGALLTFSGGVDASYTLWRHTLGDAGRQKQTIKGTVLVHGFDIKLPEIDGYAAAAGRASAITNDVGVPLIQASTNYRQLPVDWEQSHGAAVSSIHLMLQNGYSCGLIAGGHTYNRLKLPWGSQPLTDWMHSTGTYPIIHDSASIERWQKVKAVSTWEAARKNIRVCYQTNSSNNCGVCYKCIRTLLLFRAVSGALPECFDKDINDAQIKALRYQSIRSDVDRSISEILDAARMYGHEGSWTQTLKQVLKAIVRHKARQGWVGKLRRKISLRGRIYSHLHKS